MASRKRTEPRRKAARGGPAAPKGFTKAPRARWWYPYEGCTLQGTVDSVGTRAYRGGEPQPFYVVTVSEDTTDEKGELVKGSVVRVGHRAALSPLAEAVGREVWIADNGKDGDRRDFAVAFADE